MLTLILGCYTVWIGRVIAQGVSRRLLTAAARVLAKVRTCGICGGQSVTGAGFLRVWVSPANYHSTDCSTLSHHHLSSVVGTSGQLVAYVLSGLSLTPHRETKKEITRPCGRGR
jgi:hypothetical protein